MKNIFVIYARSDYSRDSLAVVKEAIQKFLRDNKVGTKNKRYKSRFFDWGLGKFN